jgi:hypothetical protein
MIAAAHLKSRGLDQVRFYNNSAQEKIAKQARNLILYEQIRAGEKEDSIGKVLRLHWKQH